jgi:hypothetical protein
LFTVVAKESVFLRLLRAECAIQTKDYQTVRCVLFNFSNVLHVFRACLTFFARYDTGRVLAIEPENARAILLYARGVYRILADPSAALKALSWCMAVASNNSECFIEREHIQTVLDAFEYAQRMEAKEQWQRAVDLFQVS